MTKAPITIAVQGRTKALRLVRFPASTNSLGYWLIWTHTSDFMYGQALLLYDNGKAENVTFRRDEGDVVTRIKPED